MIDKFNRTLGDQLGMHDMFVTRCFETRFASHFLLPCTYVNAVNAAKYFLPETYPADRGQKSMLLELAAAMAKNPAWLAVLRAQSGTGGTKAGTNYHGGVRKSISLDGGPPSRESPAKHVLVPISSLPGYKGHKQQRCEVCNLLCSWACARCSQNGKWVALHPMICQGSKRKYTVWSRASVPARRRVLVRPRGSAFEARRLRSAPSLGVV